MLDHVSTIDVKKDHQRGQCRLSLNIVGCLEQVCLQLSVVNKSEGSVFWIDGL